VSFATRPSKTEWSTECSRSWRLTCLMTEMNTWYSNRSRVHPPRLFTFLIFRNVYQTKRIWKNWRKKMSSGWAGPLKQTCVSPILVCRVYTPSSAFLATNLSCKTTDRSSELLSRYWNLKNYSNWKMQRAKNTRRITSSIPRYSKSARQCSISSSMIKRKS
jgi:hypothetical protein